jgi:hypothetical protein
VLPGYRQGPGMSFLPSGFTPVRFTKFYTNPVLPIYLSLNFKLPVLMLIGCLEQKKSKSVLPQ